MEEIEEIEVIEGMEEMEEMEERSRGGRAKETSTETMRRDPFLREICHIWMSPGVSLCTCSDQWRTLMQIHGNVKQSPFDWGYGAPRVCQPTPVEPWGQVQGQLSPGGRSKAS